MTKVVDVLDHLLPVERLLVRVRQLLQFAVEVLQFGGEFLAAELQLTESDHLRLIGIHEALALPFETLAAVLQLGLLRAERGQVLLFPLRPTLMQCGNDARVMQ